jgi:hypothetical protein
VRNGDVWVKTTFTQADLAAHWHQRLANGLAHDLGLVIAKAIHGQLAAGVPQAEIVRGVALFGAQNRDGWGAGLTILTALANLLPALPKEATYLALFHGARRVAADCDGEAPRRERAPLESRPDPAALKRSAIRRPRTSPHTRDAGRSSDQEPQQPGHRAIALPKTRGWQRKFDDPIALPNGRTLVTLEDAALYSEAFQGGAGSAALADCDPN